jgi:hypothetical protein
MKIRTTAVVALLLLAGLGSGAQTETSSGGQIAAGRKFAQTVSGACHVVVQQRHGNKTRRWRLTVGIH